MKQTRDLLIFVMILLGVTAAGIFALSHFQKETFPPYSTHGTDSHGFKAAYLLLQELGFFVERLTEDGIAPEDGDVLVIVEPDPAMLTRKKEILRLNDWVHRGNHLVLIGNYRRYFDVSRYMDPHNRELDALSNPQRPGDASRHFVDVPYGRGCFRLLDEASPYVNAGMKERGNATRFVQALWDYRSRRILFYEYGSAEKRTEGGGRSPGSVFSLLGPSGQLILLQMAMGLVLFALVKGKRFGLPRSYRQEFAGNEEESVLAVGRLMGQVALKEDALRLYYEEFIREAAHYLGTGPAEDSALENAWKERGLGGRETLREIREDMVEVNQGNRPGDTALIQAFQKIDRLREEIKRHDR
ncbi:MAG: DUF4350 domain-containing protein [Clostridia bacterium]|jgi:hypothetical protein